MRPLLPKVTEDRMRLIIETSAQAFGVTSVQMQQETRKREIVDARITSSALICTLLYGEQGVSLSSVGDMINRSHCTIIHYHKQLDNLLATNRAFKQMFDKIKLTCERKLFAAIPTTATIEQLARAAQL